MRLIPTGVVIRSFARRIALKSVRLKWNQQVKPNAKSLGDHWERIYGNAAWLSPFETAKNPWYVLLNDGQYTACFGVKTGCRAICWWAFKPDGLELTLDTHSGDVGVVLGDRELHAADIITTDGRPSRRKRILRLQGDFAA